MSNDNKAVYFILLGDVRVTGIKIDSVTSIVCIVPPSLTPLFTGTLGIPEKYVSTIDLEI